ncbi:protein IQ-DOMAIN 31 isoform X1 [Lactuca sativa]|uniref:protein IQ-DOMAIN 31 isoform X1 n=1 Tax=Lactuca sativa TaxID=4236 RepID=UPI000CD942B6|nr:protein IQ-DOMAIN 31 isoform X1 [Lactuca sativa]XP_023758341.1 protein IQ-DOMAIN 31 isoform X1 [Lactuca sativa]XP_023758343.1 protein IQ-DOMAIN 31 isoform X1 [Lactuca sativa]XP_052626648.1 protein IQ-DOMAIN 31 isoform X1 [Lactuca sativa]
MGKSPGKWMKTVLFGKKSSKSTLSKDASLDKKTSITLNTQSNDLAADSTIISTPVCYVSNINGEESELEKNSSSSGNLINAANDDELIRLEQAATKAQAAFRGYLARRAFWALKGIIRLQAVIRGHLVRRQAVATLHCMRAIVEFQAVVRGQIVRLSGSFPQILQKQTPEEHLDLQKEEVDLLQTSLKSEKLSTNAFAVKLVTSLKTKMPLNIQYDPTEPNSVTNWLSRWSTTHFWDPLPPLKKRKPIKSQSKKSKTPENNPLNSSQNKINLELNGKENEKTRRRKSLPVKQHHHVPSYMAATESAKAKLRAQAAAKVAEDGGENGFVNVRRHSLPSTTTITAGKLGLQSPRVQKPLQVNVKGGGKNNKPQITPGGDAGWKR